MERTTDQKNKRFSFYMFGLSLNEKRGFYKYEFPEIWASYLINNDPSGLEQSDIDQCDNDTKGLGHCVSVSEETNFGTYRGIGHTLATYIFKSND